MRARGWFAVTLLVVGCASLTPPTHQETSFRESARAFTESASAQESGAESAPLLGPMPESEDLERIPWRRASHVEVTAVGPNGAKRNARQSALAVQLALHGAILDVTSSTRRIADELVRLRRSRQGLARAKDVFLRYADYGAEQLRWVEAQLAAATRLANAASEVDDPSLQLALLHMAGPRLESAMLGSLLLGVWTDVLHLADVAIKQHLYSEETLFTDMWHWQELLAPTMLALSSQEHGQMEAAVQDVAPLVGHLMEESSAFVERMRMGADTLRKALILKEAIEMVTMLSTMKLGLPSVPPPAPALVGINLTVGSDGVMLGTRLVASTEWVESTRQLVRAGVLSFPAVNAAVRLQAGQVMLARADDGLPQGVREALGDGPEVNALHETGTAGAGMSESPRHHVMPREFREWFEKRGFSGELGIDEFCVKLERAHHEAIHGGGDWKLGRTWPGEWNQMIMDVLRRTEARTGRMLTRNEVLKIVAGRMEVYSIPMRFVSGRGP